MAYKEIVIIIAIKNVSLLWNLANEVHEYLSYMYILLQRYVYIVKFHIYTIKLMIHHDIIENPGVNIDLIVIFSLFKNNLFSLSTTRQRFEV